MLANTRLGWTSWSSKRQRPEEEWSIFSPTTPSGKPNRCDESTFQKPPTSEGRSESRWFVHTALLTGCFRDCVVERDRISRSLLVLLYHILIALTRTPSFPMSLNRLAELGDDLRCERNPARPMGACTYTL